MVTPVGCKYMSIRICCCRRVYLRNTIFVAPKYRITTLYFFIQTIKLDIIVRTIQGTGLKWHRGRPV